jgi:sec-independent protein translocase protein TatA
MEVCVFNIGPTELIVILIVALIVFGPKRLPEIGRTLGRSLQEFRRASNDLRQEFERQVESPTPPQAGSSNGQSHEPGTLPKVDETQPGSSDGGPTGASTTETGGPTATS